VVRKIKDSTLLASLPNEDHAPALAARAMASGMASWHTRLRDTIRAQLSLFSITQTRDPIPLSNERLGALYYVGALACLAFALADPSCEEVTSYRTDYPISKCEQMLSTFSCHTADYDEVAGLGHSKAFNARNCLGGVAELLPIVGFHPPSSCRDIVEATFACQTADYNESIGLGLSRTFTSADCPSGDDAVAVVPVFDANVPAADCRTIVEPEFTCVTADRDVTVFPARGGAKNFTSADCPHDGIGTAAVFAAHDARVCGDLLEDIVTCATTRCSHVVLGVADDDGGGVDLAYGGTVGTASPHDTCEECLRYFQAIGGHASNRRRLRGCRENFGQCCGLEPSFWAPFHAEGDTLDGDAWDSTYNGVEFCPIGSNALRGTRCVAADSTACECPDPEFLTGKAVDRMSCSDVIGVADVASCASACGETFDATTEYWGALSFRKDQIVGAQFGAPRLEYAYTTCEGTHPNANVTFATCAGTRAVPVVFDQCKGTIEMPVAYEFCDGFVTVCPSTPVSVRLSQAMAYATTWMSLLSAVYAFLGQRVLDEEEAENARRRQGGGNEGGEEEDFELFGKGKPRGAVDEETGAFDADLGGVLPVVPSVLESEGELPQLPRLPPMNPR
jgi:hypothetical protein